VIRRYSSWAGTEQVPGFPEFGVAKIKISLEMERLSFLGIPGNSGVQQEMESV